ncbi:MAG: isoprenylcysteine carboxylmethyltransferase family protein [Thermoplasmata archaeon]|nr:isoprenylcysteine carboxylmethyltransferase family protein [Thermoplasmata archaeon]MCI4337897.1 isoprenylcysteine carboxylmethyltransferase family protein [Thermoplasmata archaeon]MCI4340785.1 isoprenylcysteine carboxylmethyltransferase family protein [Thermoplasmata archaeon]
MPLLGVSSTLLVSLAYGIWLLSEIVGSLLVPAIRGGMAPARRRSGGASGVVILAGLLASFVLLGLFRPLGWATLPVVYVDAGVLLMLTGIAIRQWSIAVLGRFFSTSLRIVDHHELVEAGPYRWVRHPSYTGIVVSMVGAGLASGAWEAVPLVLVVAALIFGYRIRSEERLLLDELAPAYAAYRERTWRLVPYLI